MRVQVIDHHLGGLLQRKMLQRRKMLQLKLQQKLTKLKMSMTLQLKKAANWQKRLAKSLQTWTILIYNCPNAFLFKAFKLTASQLISHKS